MLIKKNWHTYFAESHWQRGDYTAYMDPARDYGPNGTFIEWMDGGAAASGNPSVEPAWCFRRDDAIGEQEVADVLEYVPYEGGDAASPEPGVIYEFGPRGVFSNVVVAECRSEDTGHGSVFVWLVGYFD